MPATTMSKHSTSNDLWVIAAYFNPVGFARRRSQFDVFRERLNAPLAVVELAYGERAELGPGDADILIQRRGGDVLWQKERLLNLALEALPPECTKVVWADCDLVFADPGWVEKTSRALEDVPVVQPYTTVYDMARDATPPPTSSDSFVLARPSLAALAVAGKFDSEDVPDHTQGWGDWCSPGHAWAIRRELLEAHGLYDAMVVGSGDVGIAAAIMGCPRLTIEEYRMNDRQADHYSRWAEPFHAALPGPVGVIDGDIYHLWHGRLEDRLYGRRYPDFSRFRFDPERDIIRSPQGVWRWNSDKPAMHRYVNDYFHARQEDGVLDGVAGP
jgi:hypothetical protein